MARRISVTMLSSYLYCARKLFLERVLKLFEPEKLALVKGSIRHDTIDKASQFEEEVVRSVIEGDDYESIYNKYLAIYSKLLRESIVRNKYRLKTVKLPLIEAYNEIIPAFKQHSEMGALRLYKFVEENKFYGDELWEKLVPKIKSEIRIESPELELNGIVDQIEVYPDGFIPIELKTGSMPNEGVWPGHRIQLAAYALLMEEKFGKEIKEGFVYYLDQQERRQIVMNSFLKQEVRELKDKVRVLLNGEEIPEFTGNENKCKKCGLREKCFDEKILNKLLKEKITN
ncbi:CRISPR-associated protein Cas4 [Candidatus Woesearchaeota archaeon]|nr:CRISPR-associated protein Cas4 [Candidatus Woesearchaeota archaeon]